MTDGVLSCCLIHTGRVFVSRGNPWLVCPDHESEITKRTCVGLDDWKTPPDRKWGCRWRVDDLWVLTLSLVAKISCCTGWGRLYLQVTACPLVTPNLFFFSCVLRSRASRLVSHLLHWLPSGVTPSYLQITAGDNLALRWREIWRQRACPREKGSQMVFRTDSPEHTFRWFSFLFKPCVRAQPS